MEVAQQTIKELTGAALDDSVRIIRGAFGKVAGELGITLENAPGFPAFITIAKHQIYAPRCTKFRTHI